MSETKGKKGSLPLGWIVKQSSTYKDRVYYFNQITGVSTWELPKLDETKDTKMKKTKEKDKADGKGGLKEQTKKNKTEKVDVREKGDFLDQKHKIKSKAVVKGKMEDKDKIELKVDPKRQMESKGEQVAVKRKSERNDKTESKGKEVAKRKVDLTATTEEGMVNETGSDLEEGEVVDSVEEPGTNSAVQPTATDSKQQSDVNESGSKVKEAKDLSDSDSPAESPSKRSRHSPRRHKHKKHRSKKSSKNDLSPHRSDKTGSDRGRKRCSDSVDEEDSSEMRVPVRSARELGLKPLKLDKPLRRPRTSSVSVVGPALAPKRAPCSVEREKEHETSAGKSTDINPGGLGAECRKSCSKLNLVVSGNEVGTKNGISEKSSSVSISSKIESVAKCESVDKSSLLEKSRGISSGDVSKAIERLNKAIEKTVKESHKRSRGGESDDLKSISKCLKSSPETETAEVGMEKLTKNQRKKRAKARAKTAKLVENLKFVTTQIRKVTDSPEEKRKLDALRKSQSTETSEVPNVSIQDRPVLKAVRKLHTFGQTVTPDLVQKESAVNTAGPLGPILDSMRPRSLLVNAIKPAATTTAGIILQNRSLGSKLVPSQSAIAPPATVQNAAAQDMKLSFKMAPQPQTKIQPIDFNLLNAQHAKKKIVPVKKSDRLFGRQSPDLPLDSNNALFNAQQLAGPSYVGTGADEISGKEENDANWDRQHEFNSNNMASGNLTMSMEQKVVQSEALKTIEKSGGLFGKGATKNLFGKQGNEVANRNASPVLDLESPDFISETLPLSSPEAMQQDAFFSPIHRPVTPELTMELAQTWQGMDTVMQQNPPFHTPHITGYTRSAMTEPLPLRSDMNVSPFEAALGMGNQTYHADVIESMDTDQGSSVNTKLFIVLDTNVLMQHTAYVEDLRDRSFSNLGKPVVIIPWIVMQELDSLKDNKGPNRILQRSYSAETQARLAVKFLHTCFQSKHPRIVGQTPREAALPTSGDLTIESNDDQVLQCCLQCKEKYPDSLVVLFTNDMNLCSKAMIMGIQAFTHENLQNGINNFCVVPADVDDDQLDNLRTHTPPVLVDPVQKKQEDAKKLADDILCDLKEILHEGLSIVLRSELQAVYDDVWKDIVFKKPPWTLCDILQSIKKHWIAVFGDLFGRDLECHIQALAKHFKSGQVTMPHRHLTDAFKICTLSEKSARVF
ncbi:uncharacterized protein LOC135501721 isoform X2 [Lineus longissimus]|uniref:uncharacterized protein LOC135501721 isoform X2 n=1 Tax=Lineus longissimus TaxID=88925 RepID=UPI00315DD423